MFAFWKIGRALFYCNTRFEILPFTLLPTNSEGRLRLYQTYYDGALSNFKFSASKGRISQFNFSAFNGPI